MAHNKHGEICSCGNCRAALDRAEKTVIEMLNNNECSSFIVAYAQAIKLLASITYNDHLKRAGIDGRLDRVMRERAHEDWAEKQLLEYLAPTRFGLDTVIPASRAYAARLLADHEATKNDSPTIDTPKGT